MTTTITAPGCARGCTDHGQHEPDCEGDCRGCRPTRADHGALCYRCHRGLASALTTSPGQHDWLLALLEPGLATTMQDDAAKRGTSEDLPDALHVARLSAAQELSDLLSQWVECLVETLNMRGPKRALTQHQRNTPDVQRWRWSGLLGEYIEADPPPRFEVGSACRWLSAQIDVLEATPWIGDDLGVLLDLLSRCHALAPWREQMSLLPQITCPACQGVSLALFGGEDDVRCLRCASLYSPERYAIWSRELALLGLSRVTPEPVPYDGGPLTTEAAAELVGVATFTIRAWRFRGLLTPLNTSRPLLHARADVVECHAARMSERRREELRVLHTRVLAGALGERVTTPL